MWICTMKSSVVLWNLCFLGWKIKKDTKYLTMFRWVASENLIRLWFMGGLAIKMAYERIHVLEGLS